jgi:hypothetical protein
MTEVQGFLTLPARARGTNGDISKDEMGRPSLNEPTYQTLSVFYFSSVRIMANRAATHVYESTGDP